MNEDEFRRQNPLSAERLAEQGQETAEVREVVPEDSFLDVGSSAHSPARPLVAWVVILLATITVITLQSIRSDGKTRLTGGELTNDLQAKYLVGLSQFSREALAQPAAREGFSGDRRIKDLRWVLLLHAVEDATLARKELELLSTIPSEPSAEERELLRAVTTLVAADGTPEHPAEPLSQADTDLIRNRFGWLGQLATTDSRGETAGARSQLLEQARRTVVTLIGMVSAGFLAFVLGMGLALGWTVYATSGKLRFLLRCPTGTGGYYAETFALWFVTFFGLSIVVGLVAPPQLGLTAAGVAAGLSLLTLFWPVWRGVPWRQVRSELGIVWPEGGWLELLWGVLGYLGGLPVVFAGLMLTLLLMRWQALLTGTALFAFAEPPVHPIIEPLVHGSWWIRLQAVAVVLLVPITEEIMFRGVLYRHLREAFGRWGWLVSVILSMLTSSLLFAIIHPQGPLGVPVLTAVALVLALLREWRASLIAPIVTHMIVNGVTTTFVLLIFA